MQKVIIVFLVVVMILAFLFSGNPAAQRIRTSVASVVYGVYNFFFPDQCYVPISGVSCENAKVAYSGIEITFANNIRHPLETKNYLSVFNVTLGSCNETLAAKDGLYKGEQEKFVFRSCDVGEVGGGFSTPIYVNYLEGALSYGIHRNATGILFGRVTY